MSDIFMVCPECGHDLIVCCKCRAGRVDDLEDTTCHNCRSFIHKDDLNKQFVATVQQQLREMHRKTLKEGG